MTVLSPPRALAHRPGTVVDAVFAVGVFVVIAVAITADAPSAPGDPRRLDAYAYLFAVGLGALMFARRRHPIGTLVATAVLTCGYYILQYPPIGLALPMSAALYVAAEAGRIRWGATVAGSVVALALYFRITQGEPVRPLLLYDTLLTVAVMAASMALGTAQRARAMWRAEALERARQTAIVTEQETRARLDVERARIARDLHDSLAHTLAVIALQSNVAVEAATDPEGASREAALRIREASRRAMSELRSAVGVLRTTAPATSTPTLRDIAGLAEDLATPDLAIDVTTSGDPERVPPFVGAAAYRIAQESLTNALKHGHGHHARIAVDVLDDAVRILVDDDGPPSSATRQSRSSVTTRNGSHVMARTTDAGHGIRGMSERAQILGGRLAAGPRDEGGWRVEAHLPIRR
jgi:signal transduction histidine kinase